MKTIYIHIGQTKTGTTSLQSFFLKNREILKEKNLLYPKNPRNHPIKSKHKFILDEIIRIDKKKINKANCWNFLKTQIDNCDQQKILISEELFWHLFQNDSEKKYRYIAYIKNNLLEYNVKIICFLRRQDKWIESWYNQLVKTDIIKLDYYSFIDKYKKNGLMNYVEALKPWKENFGTENLIVKPFEKDSFINGDLAKEFLNIIGLNWDINFIKIDNKQKSLSNSACELSLIFNKTQNPSDLKNEFLKIINKYDELINDERCFLNNECRNQLIDEYSKSNEELASIYGIKNQNFFKNNDIYDKTEYPGLSANEIAIYTIVAHKEIQKKILILNQTIDELKNKIAKNENI